MYKDEMRRQNLPVDYSLLNPVTSFMDIMTTEYDRAAADRMEDSAPHSSRSPAVDVSKYYNSNDWRPAITPRDESPPPFGYTTPLNSMNDLPILRAHPDYEKPSFQFNADYVRELATHRCKDLMMPSSSDEEDELGASRALQGKVLMSGEESEQYAMAQVSALYEKIRSKRKEEKDKREAERAANDSVGADQALLDGPGEMETVVHEDGRRELVDYTLSRTSRGGPVLRYNLDSGFKTPPMTPSSSEDSSRQNSDEDQSTYLTRMDGLLMQRTVRSNKRYKRRQEVARERSKATARLVEDNRRQNQLLVDDYNWQHPEQTKHCF